MERRRATIFAGIALAVVFAAVLIPRLMPEIALVGVGSRAPGFQAIDLRTGRPARLADYRGKVILLNIWATYCIPCRTEMPAIERLSHRLAGTDFAVLAVSVDVVDSTTVNAFVKAFGLTFDVWHDGPGLTQRLYQTTGVPETFIIDRDGVIVKKAIGAMDWDDPVNEILIRRLLAQAS
jgi:cytochrome c biogenesis protein CcmG, thiol:disulfide interchange protein DsbE